MNGWRHLELPPVRARLRGARSVGESSCDAVRANDSTMTRRKSGWRVSVWPAAFIFWCGAWRRREAGSLSAFAQYRSRSPAGARAQEAEMVQLSQSSGFSARSSPRKSQPRWLSVAARLSALSHTRTVDSCSIEKSLVTVHFSKGGIRPGVASAVAAGARRLGLACLYANAATQKRGERRGWDDATRPAYARAGRWGRRGAGDDETWAL